MTPNEYLHKILDSQTLEEGSNELERLRERREEVESLLREEFGSSPTMRYGGSKAKGTMIKEAYDLDVICYFPRDDEDAGGTLKELYENTKTVLSKKYVIVEKTSALRLQSRNYQDFHVDVVPGRFVDDAKQDTFLHQTSGDKKRLKTNLQTHIDHVRNSGVAAAIRLMKLWRTRRGLTIKHFALELLVIEVLQGKASMVLDKQLEHLWKTLRDDVDAVKIEDPANPTGNDLSSLVSDSVKAELSNAASTTLATIECDGWEKLFGKVPGTDEDARAALTGAIKSTAQPTRPWRSRSE